MVLFPLRPVLHHCFTNVASSHLSDNERITGRRIVNQSQPGNYVEHLTFDLYSRAPSLLGVVNTSGVILSFLRGSQPLTERSSPDL